MTDKDNMSFEMLKKLQNAQEYVTNLDDNLVGYIHDGFHTFNQLYDFRKLYNAILFNEWAQLNKYNIHKSKKHSDGKLCFGGDWFIVVAELPSGQISNHYKLDDWDLFKIPEVEIPIEFDNHKSKDVLTRLLSLI